MVTDASPKILQEPHTVKHLVLVRIKGLKNSPKITGNTDATKTFNKTALRAVVFGKSQKQ
jgi:hypothetical protein